MPPRALFSFLVPPLAITLLSASLHCGSDDEANSGPTSVGGTSSSLGGGGQHAGGGGSGGTGAWFDAGGGGSCQGGHAGADTTVAPPECQGQLLAPFDTSALPAPSKGSDEYQPPNPAVLLALGESLQAALAGQVELALSKAATGQYELCAGQDGFGQIYRWLPLDPSQGGARFAIRLGQAERLIVGAPHPFFEFWTLPEAVLLFEQLGARALIASGTHRCANSAYSACDGTTGVCSTSTEAYRDSDMAHVTTSVFQRVHEILADHYADHWVLSLHGMLGSGISLSDGTTLASAADTPVAKLGTALMETFPTQWVTSCNDWPGAVVELRLCGTTNVQGRYVNSSPAPCTDGASSSSGRFLHVEQNISVRLQPSVIATALEQALSVGP